MMELDCAGGGGGERGEEAQVPTARQPGGILLCKGSEIGQTGLNWEWGRIAAGAWVCGAECIALHLSRHQVGFTSQLLLHCEAASYLTSVDW